MRVGSKRASGAINLEEFTEMIYPSGSSKFFLSS
jgi:hypothetical protein